MTDKPSYFPSPTLKPPGDVLTFAPHNTVGNLTFSQNGGPGPVLIIRADGVKTRPDGRLLTECDADELRGVIDDLCLIIKKR